MTALEQDIPIVTVVFNNNALGWVYHGGGPFAAEFNDFDHAAIARAMGCRGERVVDSARLGPALTEAIASRQPTVLDVRTSLKQSFADITSPLAVEASPRRR
jgi:acetolactate synthase-1/2/3 large subunit